MKSIENPYQTNYAQKYFAMTYNDTFALKITWYHHVNLKSERGCQISYKLFAKAEGCQGGYKILWRSADFIADILPLIFFVSDAKSSLWIFAYIQKVKKRASQKDWNHVVRMVTSEVTKRCWVSCGMGLGVEPPPPQNFEEIWTFMGYLRAYETEENTNFRVLIKYKFVQKCN